MACPAARLLPTAPREPRSRASRPAGAVRLFDPRTQAQHKGPAPAASPKRDEDFSSEKGDVSGRSRPSRSASPEEEEIPDDASELSEDFLRSLCQGADLEDVEALEIRVDSARQSLELLGQCLPNLKRLRLSESSILCVRELGSHLSKLQVLWLGRCGLQDLDGLTLLEGLRELYLPFNDVVDVAWPKWLDHLQVLDLEGNAVEDPDDLAELRKCYALRDLTIRGNPATFLPGFSRRTFFDQLPSLEFLDDLPNFPELPVQADLPCEEPFDGDAERFLDRYLACDLDLYMDLYLRQETPEAVKEGSWRQLLQAQEIQPRLADPERFGDEPGEEILILERLKAAPRGAVMSQPSLSVAAPPCAKSASTTEGFMLRPPPRGEAGSVLTRGGAMAGAPLAALRQRRGLHGASEDSEAALLVDLDIRELLRRYT